MTLVRGEHLGVSPALEPRGLAGLGQQKLEKVRTTDFSARRGRTGVTRAGRREGHLLLLERSRLL